MIMIMHFGLSFCPRLMLSKVFGRYMSATAVQMFCVLLPCFANKLRSSNKNLLTVPQLSLSVGYRRKLSVLAHLLSGTRLIIINRLNLSGTTKLNCFTNLTENNSSHLHEASMTRLRHMALYRSVSFDLIDKRVLTGPGSRSCAPLRCWRA